MKIGELASRAGVTAQAVRYYERRGLLGKPARTVSGYRSYEPRTVELLRSIQRAKDLGFTLREIKFMRDLHRQPADLLEARRFAVSKLQVLDEKIAWLQEIRAELQETLRHTEPRPEEMCPARPKPIPGDTDEKNSARKPALRAAGQRRHT